MTEVHWREQAACKGKTNLFFPVPSGNGYKVRDTDPYDAARRLCAGCPVAEPCLNYALSVTACGKQMDGMYGGTTPHERLKILRRQRRRADRAPVSA